jgi:hypothetical protein
MLGPDPFKQQECNRKCEQAANQGHPDAETKGHDKAVPHQVRGVSLPDVNDNSETLKRKFANIPYNDISKELSRARAWLCMCMCVRVGSCACILACMCDVCTYIRKCVRILYLFLRGSRILLICTGTFLSNLGIYLHDRSTLTLENRILICHCCEDPQCNAV